MYPPVNLQPEDILPHRGAMLLVDKIIQVDSNRAQALFCPQPDWPLTKGNGVESLIMVELAAQTAGLCSGWERIKQHGPNSDPTGWLVGIKKATFNIPILPFASPLTVTAKITFTYDNLREVSCELVQQGKTIGQIILQLFKE